MTAFIADVTNMGFLLGFLALGIWAGWRLIKNDLEDYLRDYLEALIVVAISGAARFAWGVFNLNNAYGDYKWLMGAITFGGFLYAGLQVWGAMQPNTARQDKTLAGGTIIALAVILEYLRSM